MEIKITKRTLLEEQNNEMTHNWTYLVQGRIINDTKTRYRKFKLIINFDVFEYQEYREDSDLTIRDYLDELIGSYCDYINSYDDCDEFYRICNNSIIDYNRRVFGYEN